MIRTVHELIAK